MKADAPKSQYRVPEPLPDSPWRWLATLRRHIAWSVLAISLAAGTGGWLISLKLQEQGERQSVHDEVAAVETTLREHLAVYEDVLHGAVGLFAASDTVERWEWRSYLQAVSVETRFPGIDALGYVAWIPRADLGTFLDKTRKDHAPDFQVRSDAGADQLLIVKYLEPEQSHQSIIGLDMTADPEQLSVAERCRDSGQAVISAQMSLPKHEEAEDSRGFLMLLPVYRHGAPTDTVAERRANCVGLVYAQFVTGQLMQEVLQRTPLALRLQVTDRSAPPSQALVFDTGAPPAGYESQLMEEGALSIGGRIWQLRFSSTPEFDAQRSDLPSILAGAAGLLVSFLLFGIAWSLGHTRERAMSMAAGMTTRLRRANEQLQKEIVDRERAQRSIKDSEALYHSLVESLPLNIVRKDMEGHLTFANQRFCNELGKSSEEILGKTEFDLFPAEEAARHKQEDARITETGQNIDAVQELRLPGEDRRYVQVIKTPLRSGAGEVIGLQTISWDVTDKHRTEQELQRERDLLHTLLDTIPDRIYFKDEQSRFLRVSRAMLDLFGGKTPSEVIGMTDFHFFGEAHARQAYEDEQRIIRTGRPVIDLVEREDLPDGATRWALTTKMPMRNSDGRVIGTFGVSRDITQMKEAEAELRHERDLLHTLLDNSPDRIYFKDRESRFLRVSRALLLRHKVRDASEIIGKTDFDLFTEEHARQAYEDEQRIVRTGEPVIGLVEKETMPDGEIRWASTTKMPLKNDQGEIVGTFGISRDITEMKRASEALQVAKEAAEEANQTKSQFLANMSHELRTPLNSIIGFSNILAKNRENRLAESEITFLERILANGKHLLELINEILDLSKIEARKVELETTAVDLGELVRETIEQQEGLVRDRPVQLRHELPDSMAPLHTDSDKLKQVLINLIGNALKFTESGSVTIRVNADSTNHRPFRIDVIDTGIGIPKEKVGAIFQAFQQADTTTARRFGGTGLGLTISRAMCHLMGYRLEVSSEEGKGSTFSILLTGQPVVTDSTPRVVGAVRPVADAPRASETTVNHLKGKRVLVIDDEADSRLLLRHTLQEFGCEVVEAPSGEEGLRLARRSHPDLITVDLMMPRMTGAEVVGAIKGDPDLKHIPVVVVSIVSGEHRGHILGAVDLVQKPIVREELLAALQRNLAEGKPRVLVVEDEEDARAVIVSLLRAENLVVRTASNGRQALESLEQWPCDLVLLDLVMPEMDGFAFLKALRAGPHRRTPPVVVITAKDLSRREVDELKKQASDVLQKSAAFDRDLQALLQRLFKPSQTGESTAPAADDSPERP